MLTLEKLLIIHETILQVSGGASGVRDVNALEAALARPDQTAFGKELYSDIYSKAGSLLEALANHHPFVDGNKRTALAATVDYLRESGITTNFTNHEYEDFMLHVVNKRPEVIEIAKWLKKHSKKIKGI